MALQLSQFRVQCGLLTSRSGLTALLGEVDVPTSLPGEISAGSAKDMMPELVAI